MFFYLLYEVDVVNNTVFELSSTSREDKERSRFTNPILIFLVFYKFRMRNIIIPNLQTQEKQEFRKQRNHNLHKQVTRKDLTEKIETSLSPCLYSEAKEEELCNVVAKEPNILVNAQDNVSLCAPCFSST